MAKKKSLRIYALYDGEGGPTAMSEWYGRYTKTIYHVVAYSIRQAILLAARREWSTGGPGMIEYSDSSQKWFHNDGTSDYHKRVNVSAARNIPKEEVQRALSGESAEDAEE